MSTVEVRIPDIGDFKNIPIIEILVKPGDVVKADAPLLTLESDKASMEVPSPVGGTIEVVHVKVGDKVSAGSLIAVLASGNTETTSGARAQSTPEPAGTARTSTTPSPTTSPGKSADLHADVLVLGAGPGGYSAAFRAADLGKTVVLVERWPMLGGVCLNVGCIPSKALLHTAAVVESAIALAPSGITFGTPAIDLEKLRAHKDEVVGKLTSGLAGMAKARKVTHLQGSGRFVDTHHMRVTVPGGGPDIVVHFDSAIIAAGSEAAGLPFLPRDPRIVDSTGALELPSRPEKLLVIGGGIIGLEMATVYSVLGTRIDVVEILDHLMPGTDRDLVGVWQKKNAHRFDRIMLVTRVAAADARPDGIHVTFNARDGAETTARYDIVLVAIGRKPNGTTIGADAAGIAVTDKGFIAVDRQMRTNIRHIYAIGDIASPPMLAHKAVHEGHVAAENAAGKASVFDARQIPSVAYTDPEIAWTGVTEDDAKTSGLTISKTIFPWAASGRAIANGRDEGFTKLLFDQTTGRIVGGGIVGTEAGSLISEICLAIEMGADAVDIGKTIHPHPTLSESIGMAAEAHEGVCTDLPPKRRK